MHQTEWQRLALEERVDHLRIENVAQAAVISALCQALGVEFRLSHEDDELAGSP